MRVAVYQGEASITDLVTRLYQVPQSGKLSRLLTLTSGKAEALVKKAAAALLQANPSLRNLAAVPPEAVLVVPAVEGLQQTAAVAPLNAGDQAYLRSAAKDVDAAQKSLAAALADRVKQVQATLDTLQSDAVKPLAKYLNPADLDAMKAAAATELRDLQQLAKYQAQLGPQMVKDIQALANSDS